MISFLAKYWNEALNIGVNIDDNHNQKTRMIHANRMAFYSVFLLFMFALLYVVLAVYLLTIILFVFITLFVLAFVLCHQGNFNIARIMYIVIGNAAIFTFSNILGEEGGIHFVFFAIIPAIFTFFSSKEKELLMFSVFISPLLWVCLELNDYNYFKVVPPFTAERLSMIKFLSITCCFSLMFLFLFEFMVHSYRNEELLVSSISTLKVKEKELTEKNEEFKQTTVELMGIQSLLSANQTNLEKEKSKAEKALKVKTDFLSSMSHEIRTPMNVIVGLTDMLIDGENNNEKLENLQLIKNSSSNLLVIINDILDFSRMESGKLIIENFEFDIHKKINEVSRSINVRAKENSNVIDYHIADNVPRFISSDSVRINQVLINLLSNANKFTKKGRVDLFVSIIPSNSNTRSKLKFEIRDTGIGIEKDAIDKIFESFTQASSSTTRQYGGTGLGLPICKRIVDLMDGDIWVESTPNIGSSFFVEFPIRHKDIELTNKMNCLVVEDDEMNQMLIEKTLSSVEIKSSFVESFKQMQKKIEEGNFGLLLLDTKNEGFSWKELSPYIVNNNICDKFNVLIYSNEDNKEMQDIGIYVINKPIDRNEILRIKNTILSNEH